MGSNSARPMRQNRMIPLVALPRIVARHPPAGHSVRMRETSSQGQLREPDAVRAAVGAAWCRG
jgi:hypothetical protein